MICVRDESQNERLLSLEEFEQAARRGELSPFAWVKHPALTNGHFVQARKLPLFVTLYDPRRLHFQRHFQLGRLPIVTAILVCIMVILFARVTDDDTGAVTRELLLRWGAKTRSRLIENGELWRLWTANLLHTDLLHLAFNSLALMTIGATVEGIYRRGDYLAILFFSGVGAMLCSAWLNHGITVGASGAIFGCIGAALAFGVRFRNVLPRRYRFLFGGVLFVYAALMLYLGLQNPDTDNAGHIGGALIGFLFGARLTPRLLRLVQVKESWPVVIRPHLLVFGGMVLLSLNWGAQTRSLWLHWHSTPFKNVGLVLAHPAHWQRVESGLPAQGTGFFTVGNGADAFVALGCEDWFVPRSAEVAADDFIARQLTPLGQQKNIARMQVSMPVPDVLNSEFSASPSKRIDFSFVGDVGEIHAQAWVFSYGHIECVFVAAKHVGADAHSASTLSEIRGRLQRRQSEQEERTLGRVRGSPSLDAWWQRAHALEHVGAHAEARDAYAQALRWSTYAGLEERRALLYDKARFEWIMLVDWGSAFETEALLRSTWENGRTQESEDGAPLLLHRLLRVDLLLSQQRWAEVVAPLAALSEAHGETAAIQARQNVLYTRGRWPLPQFQGPAR